MHRQAAAAAQDSIDSLGISINFRYSPSRFTRSSGSGLEGERSARRLRASCARELESYGIVVTLQAFECYSRLKGARAVC